MTENIERYKVKYDPKIFGQSLDDSLPLGLKNTILGLCYQTEFYLHSQNFHFVALGIPSDKAEELKSIEGILSVTKDMKFRIEK